MYAINLVDIVQNESQNIYHKKYGVTAFLIKIQSSDFRSHRVNGEK
jgi:hypothetical protein